MYNLVFVTKPIQYVNARNAVETIYDRDVKYILIVVDHFEGATSFVDRIWLHDNIWFEVKLFNSRIEALFFYRKYKVKHILTNSDISKDAVLFKIFHPFSALMLYEEGWGNYIRDVLFDRGCGKRIVYNLLFLNRQYGASTFTKKIFLYYPEICELNLRGKATSFRYSFSEYLKKNSSLFGKVFRTTSETIDSNLTCAFILPSKQWNNNFDSIDYSRFDKVYLKPHPHTMEYNKHLIDKYNVIVLDNSYFIELIVCLAKCKVTIFHDNSMVGVYAKFENVTIHNIGSRSNHVLSRFFDRVEMLDSNCSLSK